MPVDLLVRGWGWMSEPDICWLDCDEPGVYCRTARGRVIVLCRKHALLLEQGMEFGDYSGAVLPPESEAAEWPWLPESQVA